MGKNSRSATSARKNSKFRDRWPDRPGWEALAQTMETLALACGGKAQCHKKYDYLSVSLETQGVSKEQYNALYNLAELVEQISDTEDHGEQSTVHWVRSVMKNGVYVE